MNKTNKSMPVEATRVLILGSGPAGYTAAIYTARAGLNPIVYEGIQPGGQLTTTTEIDNFPGFPQGITGNDLMDRMKEQAQRFGTDVRYGVATAADLAQQPFRITIDDEKIVETQVLIIATGATARYLGLESEAKFRGQGVSACATCDGYFYRNKVVAVVGGGDTACEEASYLASLCKKVYMIVRKPYLRASQPMQNRINNTPNIEVLFEHTTQEIVGNEQGVNGVVLANGKTGKLERVDIDGFFLAIGQQPNTDLFKPWVETDEKGYIKTIPGTAQTNVSGVFACGDVQEPRYLQAITAAGSGCKAGIDAERYIGERKF